MLLFLKEGVFLFLAEDFKGLHHQDSIFYQFIQSEDNIMVDNFIPVEILAFYKHNLR